VDIKGRLIVLDIMSSVTNDHGDPIDFLAREYIKEFDYMEDVIELNTTISENEIVILDFFWLEEWNYEYTECDSYFKEIKE
jgi:hypothetical protein